LTPALTRRCLPGGRKPAKPLVDNPVDRPRPFIASGVLELGTRFAKQLTQVFRGAVVIGLGRTNALRLAIRCARDSMPPLRLAIIDDVAAYPGSTPTEVRRRLKKPWSTIDRQLQAPHMLKVVDLDEHETLRRFGKTETQWRYSLAEGIDPNALLIPSPEKQPRGGLRGKEVHLFSEEDTEEDIDEEAVPAPSCFSADCATSVNGDSKNAGLCIDGCGQPASPPLRRCDKCHADYLRVMQGYDQ
jgi:hypothetical protein